MRPVKVKCRVGRGAADTVAIVEGTMDTWDKLEEARGNLNEEETKDIKDHFVIKYVFTWRGHRPGFLRFGKLSTVRAPEQPDCSHKFRICFCSS